MDAYKEAYLKLFNRITDAIRLLEFAQSEAEEHIIHAEEEGDGEVDS